MPARQRASGCCKETVRRGRGTVQNSYEKILALETTPEALEATVSYLSGLIKPFLSTLEPVLICFPDEGPASLGGIFKEAVRRCEATPVFWGPDYRWMELLRLAFDTHANTVIGDPQIVMGLMKLAKFTATPLYVYDVIICGEPFPRWMINGFKSGLDCKVWGCYAVQSGPIVAGFSCEQEAGIHIREDVFVPVICQKTGQTEPFNRGRLYFAPVKNPELMYDPELFALVQHQPCSCGCDAPRVVEATSVQQGSDSQQFLDEELLSWSSVLDYRSVHTESGVALELVVFPGELIPKLPSCAKRTVRFWDPDRDVPFSVQDRYLKIPEKHL